MATRSLSEDELQAMEGKARKLTILDLKKQALAAKQDGDIETAKSRLKEAKKLETEDAGDHAGNNNNNNNDDDEPPFSSTLPLFWKKVALLCKQAGDIDRAKQALVHSKDLEAAAESSSSNDDDGDGDISSSLPPAPKPDATTAAAAASDPPPPMYDDDFDDISPPPPPPPAYGSLLDNCRVEGVENEEEAAMLAELMGGGNDSQKKTAAPRRPNPPVATEESAKDDEDDDDGAAAIDDSDDSDDFIETAAATPAMAFTDEELMDEEMMTEFAVGGVQGIPTQEEYAAKVLSYKRTALKLKKDGNIPEASKNLRFAKQLEKVALALQSVGNDAIPDEDDPQSWLDTLNPEESELLGELFDSPRGGNGGSDDSFGDETGASTTDRLTLDDLEEMDDDNDVMELVEMMGAGALPTVEEVTEKINEEKQKAVAYKKEGNIEMAKSSLLKSKKAKLQAVRLAEIYRKLEMRKNKGGGGNIGIDSENENENDNDNDTPVSMEALEALLGGDPKPREPAPKTPTPPKDPWLLKPSAEIKAEVIRLKNEKQVQEATRLLKLLKQKLAAEQKAADRERVAKMVTTIQKRLEVCTTQRRLWQYYYWFGKERMVGAGQYQEWTAFANNCQKAIRVLQTEGSASVKLAPRSSEGTGIAKGSPAAKKLYLLEEDLTSLVESCTNDTVAASLDAANAATSASNTDAEPNPNFLEENTLEVAVLGLFQMEENEKLQKILSKKHKSEKAVLEEAPDVRVHAKLQLPIEPEDPSKPFLFDLEPSDRSLSRKRLSSGATAASEGGKSNAIAFQYGFDPSSKICRRQVPLPRKDPKHERTLLRRMETKTIQLSVFYLHNQNKRKELAAAAAAPKKKSWFFGYKEATPAQPDAGTSESETKDTFLGKITIEVKPLLSRGCLTGDFPILVNSRPIGGVLRVCLRTRPVLDPDRYEGLQWSPSDGAPPSLSITTYKQGLSFTFPNEIKGQRHSIESIKQESISSSSAQGTN